MLLGLRGRLGRCLRRRRLPLRLGGLCPRFRVRFGLSGQFGIDPGLDLPFGWRGAGRRDERSGPGKEDQRQGAAAQSRREGHVDMLVHGPPGLKQTNALI